MSGNISLVVRVLIKSGLQGVRWDEGMKRFMKNIHFCSDSFRITQSQTVLHCSAEWSQPLSVAFEVLCGLGSSSLPPPRCPIAPRLCGSGSDFSTPRRTRPSLLGVSIAFSCPLVSPTSHIPTDPSRLNPVSSGLSPQTLSAFMFS